MTEMTLEERVLRLEAHLGIGDSPEAIATREDCAHRSDMMRALMNPFLASSEAFLKECRQRKI